MMGPLAIQTTHLSKRFPGGQGVHDLSLSVEPRSIYGFLGPNGAGKTTSIRLMLSLLAADAGEVRLFGQPVSRRARSGLRRVGALVESPSLYRHLSGEHNLEVTRRLLDLPRRRVGEVLELVSLREAAHRKVREYSLGMRQRLALALALLSEPGLLILDEPANGLDPAGIQTLRELLRSLARDRGLTIFLSSHQLSEIELVASHVGVLQAGRLLFEGELGELRRRIRPKLRIVCSDPDRAAELLDRAGEPAHERQGEALLVQPRAASSPQLNRLLVEAGVEVAEIALSEASLETLFFALTAAAPEAAHA